LRIRDGWQAAGASGRRRRYNVALDYSTPAFDTKEDCMAALIQDWKSHCTEIIRCAQAIFETDVKITEKGFADPTYLALTLLARTVSNLKGTMILLDATRIVEARTIARCCLENLYWTVGLAEQGDAFVRQMRDDEFGHRKATGQAIFASETELDRGVEDRLRAFMRDLNKTQLKTLSPKVVAAIRDGFDRTYLFYSQLSSDSAHPSVTALNRYVVSDHQTGAGFDVEPLVRAEEVVETFEYLSMACVGVCVAVNQIIGGTVDLGAIAARHTALSHASVTARGEAPKA
jgi:Family of unknown function (DUF5677)